MKVIEYADGYTPGANRYGYGYHDLRHTTCPNCGRETRRANLKMKNMGAKSRVCPWCSKSVISRALLTVWKRAKNTLASQLRD